MTTSLHLLFAALVLLALMSSTHAQEGMEDMQLNVCQDAAGPLTSCLVGSSETCFADSCVNDDQLNNFDENEQDLTETCNAYVLPLYCPLRDCCSNCTAQIDDFLDCLATSDLECDVDCEAMTCTCTGTVPDGSGGSSSVSGGDGGGSSAGSFKFQQSTILAGALPVVSFLIFYL